MLNKLSLLKNDFISKLSSSQSENEVESIKNEFLWKEWSLKEILAGIKDLSPEDKKTIGVEANILRQFFEEEISKKRVELKEAFYNYKEKQETIDVTLEYPLENLGHMHPISTASRMLEEIFISLGFKIEDGPQIETEEYNFDKLNIPDNHPARDVWDTFWVHDDINKERKSWDKYLLRTHTSPVQIRTMLKWKLPIKVIIPGRVYRYEQEDARHTCNFYQLEWLVVWEWVTFWDLKWTLDTAMKKLLWDDTKTRFRPSIFPFTEPSAEVDVSCQLCKWEGCRMCSGSGWVELLWSGMVHPRVLEMCWIDPEKYTGFAFGMWIDRIAAQRFGVSSSRMFYQNKLKLNEQF
jgi:phenylalanyl-tRNA synthetase alpha chain